MSIHQRATLAPFDTRPCHHRSLILVWHLVSVFFFSSVVISFFCSFLSLSISISILLLICLLNFVFSLRLRPSIRLMLLSLSAAGSVCRYLGPSISLSVRSLFVPLVLSLVRVSVRSPVSICPSVQKPLHLCTATLPGEGGGGWGEGCGAKRARRSEAARRSLPPGGVLLCHAHLGHLLVRLVLLLFDLCQNVPDLSLSQLGRHG